MAIRHYVYAAGIAAGLSLLAACSDEVTEVTNVSEKATLDQVKKFKELPKCDEDADGSMVYVKDSAKVFVCIGGDWDRLNGKNGADGADGKDGKNGSDGKDGSGCTVKQNKKKTGFDLVCDGKKVGSIENGSDGKDGSDGEDGSGCTLKQNKKKGGYDIVCDGVTKGTVVDGDDGSDCVLKEGKNGQVDVKCGQKTTTLYKALCGSDSFDPETQFCVENKAYLKCHQTNEGLDEYLNDDGTYDVNEFFCDKIDLLLRLCGPQKMAYDYSKQFCSQYIPIDRCKEVAEGVDPDALYKNGMYSETTHFCHNGVLWKNCGGYAGTGYGGIRFNPDEQFCSSDGEDAQVADLCGKKKKAYDITDSMCVNGKVQYAKACCKPNGAGENWCEEDSHMYDVRTQFCDARDGHSYEFVEVVQKNIDNEVVYSETWMAQNLKYENSNGTRKTSCFDNDSRNCETYGRLYNWAAALESCPDGWRMPTKDDWAVIANLYTYYSIQGKPFNGDLRTGLENNTEFITERFSLWSSDENETDDRYAIAFGLYDEVLSVDGTWAEKSFKLAVRCIKKN